MDYSGQVEFKSCKKLIMGGTDKEGIKPERPEDQFGPYAKLLHVLIAVIHVIYQ